MMNDDTNDSTQPVGLGAMTGSGDWDVERTHGRLCKVQYDVGCKEAEAYCDKLRADGWKAWSVSIDGKRVTEVFYLRYTNTAHKRQLPSQNNPAMPREASASATGSAGVDGSGN